MRVTQLLTILCVFFASPLFAQELPRVALQTNVGTITLELDSERAPTSVENFLGYVNSGFYNETLFHRVIDGFMIQGGGFSPKFMRKQTQSPIRNEANNGLKNDVGTIAMARTPDPHSASSQFFINLSNNDFLNFQAETDQGWGYCVFGKTIEGMDTVNAIAKVSTGNHGHHGDVPKEAVVIESITVS